MASGPKRDTPGRISKATVVAVLGVVAILVGGGFVGGVLRIGDEGRSNAGRIKAEMPVTPMELTLGASNNSPALAADPTEDRFVVLANRLDAPDFSCALQVSGDGGQGWVTARPVRQLPKGADKCYAPEVAFDSSGKLYYLFVGLAGRGNEPMGVFLTTSTDRGRTFSAPQEVLGPLNFAVRMAIDPTVGGQGRIHLVWIKATSDPPTGGFGPPPNPIMAAHSDDGGRTFSAPVQVSDPERERVVAPALVLGPDHAVHVAYYDLQRDAIDYLGLEGNTWEGNWTVILASSSDGGRGFARGEVVDDAVVPSERVMLIFTMPPPALAVDGDRRCAAWTDARNGDADVLLRCSPMRGRPWGSVRRLNDDPLGNGRSQYLPRLSVSPGGRLDAIFYDRRTDPQNVLNDVAFTASSDGGQHFTPTIKLSSDASDSRIGQQYIHAAAKDQFEFGSRLALMSRRGAAVAAWTDTRNSRQGGMGQDLFAAQVVFPSGQRPWARLLGIALIALGLVSMGTVMVQRRHRRHLDTATTDDGEPAREETARPDSDVAGPEAVPQP